MHAIVAASRTKNNTPSEIVDRNAELRVTIARLEHEKDLLLEQSRLQERERNIRREVAQLREFLAREPRKAPTPAVKEKSNNGNQQKKPAKVTTPAVKEKSNDGVQQKKPAKAPAPAVKEKSKDDTQKVESSGFNCDAVRAPCQRYEPYVIEKHNGPVVHYKDTLTGRILTSEELWFQRFF